MKSYRRRSKTDRSTIAKIDRAIRLGWKPGMSVRETISRRRHHRGEASHAS